LSFELLTRLAALKGLIMQIQRISPLVFLIIFSLILSSCTTVKFVQPYDEALVTGVQDFYKKSAIFVEKGKNNSPEQRPTSEDTKSGGHLLQYENDYNLLVIDTNLLVMRAMVNSVKLDELGKVMQDKVTELIDQNLPSVCVGNQADLGGEFTSLTVKNFADLKCLISNWKVQHEKAPNKTLTKSDWERRHKTLLSIIFAIQKAESFKQIEKTI
jgi:hypothetical protein